MATQAAATPAAAGPAVGPAAAAAAAAGAAEAAAAVAAAGAAAVPGPSSGNDQSRGIIDFWYLFWSFWFGRRRMVSPLFLKPYRPNSLDLHVQNLNPTA